MKISNSAQSSNFQNRRVKIETQMQLINVKLNILYSSLYDQHLPFRVAKLLKSPTGFWLAQHYYVIQKKDISVLKRKNGFCLALW